MTETTVLLTSPYDAFTITGTGVESGPTYDRLTDWERVGGVVLDKDKRPMRHGDYRPERSTLAGLVFSIEGQLFAQSVQDAALWRERLLALYADGAAIVVAVTNDLGTTSREAFVQEVSVPWTARPFLKYTIDLYAPDPRRYGPPVAVSTGVAKPGSGLQLPYDAATGVGLRLPNPDLGGLDFGTIPVDGRVAIANAGWAATEATYTVSGGAISGGFEVVNVGTGQRLVYSGEVADGATYTLDSDAETAFINGTAPAGRFVTLSEWWSLPPRSSTVLQFLPRGAVTGSPTLTVTARAASY